MTVPATCITSAQIAADMAASLGPVIEQLIALSWIWGAIFFFLGWIFGPPLTFAVLFSVRVLARRLRRARAA